jgi:hypothetical protein
MDSPDDEPDTTDWCVGGCTPWKETEEGRARFEALATKNTEERDAGRRHVPIRK